MRNSYAWPGAITSTSGPAAFTNRELDGGFHTAINVEDGLVTDYPACFMRARV